MIDENIIRECYRFLNHDFSTEIRIIDPLKKEPPQSFFVNTEDEFVTICKTYNGRFNLYAGINERIDGGTEGKDVISVKTIVIDIDAVRAPGFEKEPATDAELVIAERTANRIIEDIKKTGQPLPVVVNSGNGFQLWFAIPRIDINDKNRSDIQDKLQEFQEIIIRKYSENCSIDKIGDLPRIIKIWGTLNIKSTFGRSTADRPFRLAKVIGPTIRDENLILAKHITELKIIKNEPMPLPTGTVVELDNSLLPRPIDYLLNEYKHTSPAGWMRIVETLAAFFKGIGLPIDKAINKIIHWSSNQPYREANEEYEIQEIVKRIYTRDIKCPNFDKLVLKGTGYPFFGLREKFEGVDLGTDWQSYVNPVNYYNVKRKEQMLKEEMTEDKLRIEVLSLLAISGKDPMSRGKATELVVRNFINNNFIYTTRVDKKPEVWIYEEGVYVPEGESYIKEYCRRIFGEAYTSHLVSQVIDKIQADTFIDQDLFFLSNYKEEVAVENGILNLKTKELLPFDPKKIFFNKCPVNYDPSKNCPLIDEFLGEVLSKSEDKTLYYEMGGFCLLKEYRFEKAFMLIGSGRNGKGKSIDLIKRVLGPKNCCAIPLVSLTPDNFQLSELFGKLANLAGDIGNTDLKDMSMFKGLTGRDLINVKRKFLQDLTFENYAKFIFACNELPTTFDHSKGFWDRWILLEYPYYFTDKEEIDIATPEEAKTMRLRDENKINKIATPDELSGLLNRFLEGLDRINDNGRFSNTLGSNDIKQLWVRKSNSFMAFAMDCLEQDYESKITRKVMRKLYSDYCKRHKIPVRKDSIIRSILMEEFGATEERFYNNQTQAQEYYWIGVKLSSPVGLK